MAYLIALAYLAICVVLFRLSIEHDFNPLRRIKFYALAFGAMCMGSGRLLYALAPEMLATYEWIFNLAHISWITFLALNIYTVRHLVENAIRRRP